MNQERSRTKGNTLFMRIASPAHVIRALTVSCIVTQFASESFGICRFRGSCTRECHLRSLINPRVLKIVRSLHVKMLRWTLPLLRFDRERMQRVYEVILLYKISRNHLLSENMQ